MASATRALPTESTGRHSIRFDGSQCVRTVLTLDTLDCAIERAVNYIGRNQLVHGEFRSYMSGSPWLQSDCLLETSTAATCVVLYSLGFVRHPSAGEIIRKGISFLKREVVHPGIWRYWTQNDSRQIDPDLDDTCLASFLLHKHDRSSELANISVILSNRAPDGLFLTFFRPKRSRNDIDAVVNANVLLYLGERTETAAVSAFLNRIVSDGQAHRYSFYYPDKFSVYYAITRAYLAGVHRLEPSRDAILRQVHAELIDKFPRHNPLTTAHTACILLNLGQALDPVLRRLMATILYTQGSDGAWDRAMAWAGPEPPGPHTLFWGSEEITTALCLEALSRYRAKVANSLAGTSHRKRRKEGER
jgi:hypothetical protein